MSKMLNDIGRGLESGVNDLLNEDSFKELLRVTASTNMYEPINISYISKEFPNATYLASKENWTRLGRKIKDEAEPIEVYAPVKSIEKIKRIVTDPITRGPILDKSGNFKFEEVEIKKIKIEKIKIFDISQTEGKEVYKIKEQLEGNVTDFTKLRNAIINTSEYPIIFGHMEGRAKGVFTQKDIRISDNLSEKQTIKTMIHELAHSRLHTNEKGGHMMDRGVKETQAEAIAYTVCNKFGLDTSDYSFPYLIAWDRNKNTDLLKKCLPVIIKESKSIIDEINKNYDKELNISNPKITKGSSKDYDKKPKGSIKMRLSNIKTNKISSQNKNKNMLER